MKTKTNNRRDGQYSYITHECNQQVLNKLFQFYCSNCSRVVQLLELSELPNGWYWQGAEMYSGKLALSLKAENKHNEVMFNYFLLKNCLSMLTLMIRQLLGSLAVTHITIYFLVRGSLIGNGLQRQRQNLYSQFPITT